MSDPKKALLGMISAHTALHGFAPSQIELQKAMGWGSVRAVQYHLGKMEDAGLIVRTVGKARSLRVVEGTSPRTVTPGSASGMETAIRFVRWMDAHHGSPTWQEVRERFGLRRSTAYRWLKAYRETPTVSPSTT
jgi:SOS-response transcriptional repressor LexA